MPKLSEVSGSKPVKLSQVSATPKQPQAQTAKPSLFRADSDFRKRSGVGIGDMLWASAKDMFGSRQGSAEYLAKEAGGQVVHGADGSPMIRLRDGSTYRMNDAGIDNADVANVAGNVAAFFLPASWAGRAAQARNAGLIGRMAAQGGAASATDATIQAGVNDGNVDLKRSAIVGLFGAGGEAASAGVRGIGNLLQSGANGARALVTSPTTSGAQREAVRTIQGLVDDPRQLLTVAPSKVPGAQRTLFEETLIPSVARLETRARGAKGDFWANFDAANDTARQSAIGKFAGDEASINAAQAARAKATDPLYAQANKVTGVDTSRLVSQIKRLEKAQGGRPAVQRGLADVRNLLVREVPEQERKRAALAAMQQFIDSGRKSAADFEAAKSAMSAIRRGEVPKASITSQSGRDALKAAQKAMNTTQNGVDDMQTIANVRLTIGDMLSGKYGGDNGQALAGSRALMAVKGQLDRVAAKASPEFAEATQNFRAMSHPINRMQAGQELLRRGSSAITDPISGMNPLQPGRFGGQVKNLDALVQGATGFRKASAGSVFRPEDLQTIGAVNDDLSRSAARLRYGNGGGSHTASQAELGMKMASRAIFRRLPWLGQVVEHLDAAAQQRVGDAMSELLANPAEFRRVMSSLPPNERQLVAESFRRISAPIPAASALVASGNLRSDGGD